MTQDDLLQRDARAEAERASAQSSDRAGRHLHERESSGSRGVVDANLGVHRSLGQSDRGRATGHEPFDVGDHGGREA